MEDNKNKKNLVIDENTSLFKLGWPIFAQVVLSLCIGYVDSMMLSHYNEDAVGGIGNANSVLSLLTLAFTVISSATGVMVAQYLGAKKKKELNRIYTLSVSFYLAVSLVISLILFVFAGPILRMMKVNAAMYPYAMDYIRILGGFLFLQALFDSFSQIFRSNGMTKVGMLISLAINILNIGGNWLFLYGPLSYLELGVKGVAISSVVSRAVALCAGIIYFKVAVDGDISLKYLKPFPAHMLKKLLMLGLPTAGENISYNMSQFVVTTIVNVIGPVAVNTKIYANILCNFAFMYSLSAAMATSIVVGHAVGAGKYDFAKKRVLKTSASAMTVAVSMAVLGFLLSDITFGTFTRNPEILKLASKIMFIQIFLEIGRTLNLVILNAMRASGDVKFPTILGIASNWGITVVFAALLGLVFRLGLIGVWIALAMDEIVRGIIALIRWRQGKWMNKRVVTEDR